MSVVTHPIGLARQLREHTKEDHQQAEGSSFMTALIDGTLSVDAYSALARQLHAVYRALEDATQRYADDADLHGFVLPELVRLPALESDLRMLAGPDWALRIDLTTAARAYAARVAEVGASWPGGLVAHHYVRYLGDLSGGQILQRRLAQVHGIPSDGLSFFDFPQIPKPKTFKDAYRARLDALPWDEDERARVVEEARVAFRLNRAVFAELGDGMRQWTSRP